MLAAGGDPWPALEAGYQDEFGVIDGRVYETAGQVRARAERLAQRVLGDPHRGRTLLLQASAAVSAASATGDGRVQNLTAYLLTTFRRLVVAEASRATHQRSLALTYFPGTAPDPTPALDRRILIGELQARMDPWTRHVAALLLDGRSFREIAVELGGDPGWVRRRFAARTARLVRRRT